MDQDEYLARLHSVRSAPCRYCGVMGCAIKPKWSIGLKKISESNKSEWLVEGEVALIYCMHGLCLNCGNMFEIVKEEIPVLYPSIKCQICNSSDHMECRIVLGEFESPTFMFTAKMECKGCGEKTRRKVAKVIEGIGRITKIKISLNGIEVEKAP